MRLFKEINSLLLVALSHFGVTFSTARTDSYTPHVFPIAQNESYLLTERAHI